MRKLYISIIALILSTATAQAQSAADYAVQLQVSTQASPPQIQLNWKKISGASGYAIARKAKGDAAWNNIATLTAVDSTYIDATIAADSAYEYKVTKSGGSAIATGYIYAGVRAPAIHSRGTLILMVDSTFLDSCRAEITQLMSDLRGDGWAIIRHDVGRTAKDTTIRKLILADHSSRPDVTALLLLGHIAVPYSGNIAPDGHTPDHQGAWPADTYYADVDGSWTDFSVNNNGASRAQNRNIPGDGKWDQTFLASEAELQTGRIDFANMPAIKRTEIQLMRNYLNKAHSYKLDLLSISRKGLVDDSWGAFGGEAFAANAWRLFPAMIGRDNIVTTDYLTSLKDSSYQWSLGGGAGSHTSAAGIGVTGNFDTSSMKGIFTMLFGSYFGDWDATNNFLRAPLCAPEPALTSCWTGRPNWFLHHMALGEPIGYGTRLTQNNNINLYTPTNHGAYMIHVSLMGDPTLRSDYIRQPQNLAITPAAGSGAYLSWTASPDADVIGYYVYRSDSEWGVYGKISGLLTTTSFTDMLGKNGMKYYLVRPAKLQRTPSGGYYNLGVGIVDSAIVTYPPAAGVARQSATRAAAVFPNPASGRLNMLVEADGREPATITLTNAAGSVMHSERGTLHAGDNTFSWDVSAWPEGLYTISLHTDSGIIVKKWVKAGAH